MALHGALIGQEAGTAASPGFLASARGVQLHVLRLDDLPGAGEGDELRVEAARLSGDARQILYTFNVTHQGRPVADGRAAVVLNTPLPA
jgi:predicted hotdog family 3-hydroxylacyl-ACP dehydratase